MIKRNRWSDNLWTALFMASLMMVLVAAVTFAWQPALRPQLLGTPTPSATPRPSPTLTPTSTPSPTATPTPTPTSTSTPTPTAISTPTPTLTPSPVAPASAQEEPLAQDHYWLARPIGPAHTNRVSHFYPYGSTAGGRYAVHHGVEFENPIGTPVLAVAEGTVVVAGHDRDIAYGPQRDFYGQLVVLRLARDYGGQPLFVLYGHLSRVLVEVGQSVETETVLGEVGESGVALGPHLHFEVRVGKNTYDHTRNPELWLAPLTGQGTIAGRVLGLNGRPLPGTLVTLHRAESPLERWRETETYGRGGVNPDDEWGENFVFGDVPAGSYIVYARIGSKVYGRKVEVQEGKTAFAIIGASKQ